MFDYKLEHLVSHTAQLAAPPEVIGPVPEGIRTNVYVNGGEAAGPVIKGRLRPAGGDWGAATIPLRIHPRFWTAHPKYAWLNRIFCAGIGAVDSATFTVTYDVYAVK